MSEEGQEEPSMEDILASIRKVLSEEEEGAAKTLPEGDAASDPEDLEVIELTYEMMVDEQKEFTALPGVAEQAAPASQPVQEKPHEGYGKDGFLADQVEQVAGAHISQLARAVAQERALTIGNQGITIEQIVREICTPILKQWLDKNLPYMVERIVRQEVERIVSRSERM